MAAKTIVIKALDNSSRTRDSINIGSARSYNIDFSPWAENNNTVTSVTWTVKNGSASISGESLTSNVANALITFSQAEKNLIEIKGITTSETFVTYLEVLVKDPSLDFINDYDFR